MNQYKYITQFPKPFLEDLVSNKVLPIIGAGFSKNAIIPSGTIMPSWKELGNALADEISEYEYTGTLDAISAYQHEYSRPKLVEKLGSLLNITTVKAGKCHNTFCDLQFDIVCTTNFEFLLEEGYGNVKRYCKPIIEEEQLSISSNESDVTLLKLHGDLHHPKRLIVAEEDYDRFLTSYPMIATFLANLLILRTPLFIGYSLDDTDFRQIWQVIKDRLGNLKRQAYTIRLNCSNNEKARFERRGVKVINIEDKNVSYSEFLETVFTELKLYWNETVSKNIVAEDNVKAEISLPAGSINRLCYFAIPLSKLPYYKKYIFPIATKFGLVPVSADDLILPGDNWTAKISSIMSTSKIIVVDVDSKNTRFELNLAQKELKENQILLIVTPENKKLRADYNNHSYFKRSEDIFENSIELENTFNNWFESITSKFSSNYNSEPRRLLELKEYNASIIAAISSLNSFIYEQINFKRLDKGEKPIYISLRHAVEYELISQTTYNVLRMWESIRNKIVHEGYKSNSNQAKVIVNGIEEILKNKTLPTTIDDDGITPSS